MFFLFEFMDLNIPESLRRVMHDILGRVSNLPGTKYYDNVATKAERIIRTHGIEHAVELGAGDAPIARKFFEKYPDHTTKFIVCDLKPNRDLYQSLEKQYGERMICMQKPVNMKEIEELPERSLLILCSSFHHIHPRERTAILRRMLERKMVVLLAEPLQKNLKSILACFISLPMGLLMPLLPKSKSNILTRIFWCWIVPLAPLLIFYDGIISCLRQWNGREWHHTGRGLGSHVEYDKAIGIEHFIQLHQP